MLQTRTQITALARRFAIVATSLILLMGALQIGAALRESPTNDEPVHLMAGYVYLNSGRYDLDLDHPPLGRVLSALPLLTLPLRPIDPAKAGEEIRDLIWRSPAPAETIILRARLVTIALSMLLGAWLAVWTRRHFGPIVALVALTLFVFDPTFIAHGHYITTDLIAALGIFLTCTLWADFLLAPSSRRLLASSLALGFALASKFSSVSLVLVLPALFLIAWALNRAKPFGIIKTIVVMLLGSMAIVFAVYAPVGIPGYFEGLLSLTRHNGEGWRAYLMGSFSRHGWWYYFPVAFLVKTPTGVLLGCLIALACLRRRVMPVLLLICLVLPPAVYFALAVRSSINIGVRHILPVYPFLFVVLAYLLVEFAPRWSTVAVLALVAVESLSIYPHELSFFNWASGGPVYGPHYLLDSNVDWGQDVSALARFTRTHDAAPLCTALFSSAPLDYYGIQSRDLNQTGMPEGIANLRCVMAISANPLYGLYDATKKYQFVREQKPWARIGYSIYLYDLRR
jgi:hypothetical protein